ncbi:hypothetical protein OS493_007376 [Desmophyllum pertusum]|uniref:Uncharacterized protein n=1 Tax=Desmophyllum pertusum TaxID=174260 RepID=A0A9X0CSW5_9CNID|nr:hypothetical protein OS493_007376 [Desmophyllum pertusum]
MWTFIVVLAVVILITEKCGGTTSQDVCIRKRFFLKKGQDAVLINHVIAVYQVLSEIDCGHRCMRESKCVSFNYEDHRTSLPHVCEISDERKQNDLQSFIAVDGFSYFELKDPFLCNAVSCHNGGQCVEQCDGHRKCICAEGYTGAHCEIRLSKVANEYSGVTLDGPDDKYRLKFEPGGFHGNIGNCGGPSNWQYFTTRDSDNDEEPSKNCATEDHAGWWYKACSGCGNLNRQSGPKWDSWHIGIFSAEIKIR